MDKDDNIDKQQSLVWTKDRFITSDLEGYMGTITEQELPTKYIRINKNVIREKHLLLITNADYVTQLLKTLHV